MCWHCIDMIYDIIRHSVAQVFIASVHVVTGFKPTVATVAGGCARWNVSGLLQSLCQ
jgi:hypothetical protein